VLHALEGRSPWEHPAAAVLKARRSARDSRKGESPETAARRAGPPLRRVEKRRVKRYVGPSRWKRRGTFRRGEGSEGRIPGALPARNRAGTESKGESRQEGSQTLKADRSGQVKLATSGSSIPDVLKGRKVHERSRLAAAGWLGFAGQDSGGRRNSQRGHGWELNCCRRSPRPKNHRAEGMASGKVGSPNP
jgi:hypothetical protein